ncbi:MAG TPA: hypothetical protein VGM06_18065 [Polyangiaceae bacterium]
MSASVAPESVKPPEPPLLLDPLLPLLDPLPLDPLLPLLDPLPLDPLLPLLDPLLLDPLLLDPLLLPFVLPSTEASVTGLDPESRVPQAAKAKLPPTTKTAGQRLGCRDSGVLGMPIFALKIWP